MSFSDESMFPPIEIKVEETLHENVLSEEVSHSKVDFGQVLYVFSGPQIERSEWRDRLVDFLTNLSRILMGR